MASTTIPTQFGGVDVDVDGVRFVLLTLASPRDASPTPRLTPSERQVLTLAIAGMSTRQIARERNVSYRTVANQLASIYRKAGVNSRSELIALFVSHL